MLAVVFEVLDLILVLDGASPSDIRHWDDVGVHGSDEEVVVGNIAIRNISRSEVVRDSYASLVRCTRYRRVSVLMGGGGGGIGGKGREQLNNSADEIWLSVSFRPRRRDEDVV